MKDKMEENTDFTKGRVIKLVEELDFGVIETSDSDFLFFHISNFDEDINIEDIKEGDLIMCQREVQESDGKEAAINCHRIAFKGYLKNYFIDNTLEAPSDVERFDEFYENAKEYAGYLKEAGIRAEDLEGIAGKIMDAEDVVELKVLRPSLAEKMREVEDNSSYLEFLEILDQIISQLSDGSEDSMEFRNIKTFMKVVFSYISVI